MQDSSNLIERHTMQHEQHEFTVISLLRDDLINVLDMTEEEANAVSDSKMEEIGDALYNALYNGDVWSDVISEVMNTK